MNTEFSQDNAVSITIGQRLRQAREQLGLSLHAVADRLCLKVSTVRDIEEDALNSELTSTFVRGYIRSYARLVNLPENDLLPIVENLPTVKSAAMQSFSLAKRKKKRDGWLMGFTWLVLLVVIGLTGAWWWQNHKAQQDEIVDMVNSSSAKLEKNQQVSKEVSVSGQSESGISNSESSAVSANQPSDNDNKEQIAQSSEGGNHITDLAPSANAQVSSPSQSSGLSDVVNTPSADALALNISFHDDCWLQVTDAQGKVLFSGMQKQGDKLSLSGAVPYKVIVGAPRNVNIEYQGKPVDLSQFVKSNRVARFTVAMQ